MLGQGLRQRSTGFFADADRLRRRSDHARRLVDVRQLDQADPVAPLCRHVRRDAQREPRLAEPGCSRDGEQPGLAEQIDELGQLLLTPDEAGQLSRQPQRYLS